MFSTCLRACCWFNSGAKNNLPLKTTENLIFFDNSTKKIGHEVIVLKNGSRVCGSGGVLTNVPLLQSKSYFEIKIQQSGHWSVGLATMNTDLNKPRGGQDKFSWCLNAENLALHDNQILYNLNEMYSNEHPASENDKEQLIPSNEVRTAILPTTTTNQSMLPQEGDILGVAYNHEELNFYLNGKNLSIPMLIKMQQNAPSSSEIESSEIYPCVFVDDGAILDLIVDNFNFPIPAGYDKIMIEQSLL